MNLKYFSLLFSIIGIALLYFLSTLSNPVVIDISQLSEYEGKQVTVKGIVIEHQTTTYDSQLIKIKEGNSSAIAFIEGSLDIQYGDKIEVTGKVQKYKENWEIVVDNVRNVNIIHHWQNITIPLWELAQNPSRYQDLNVNVSGYIEAVHDSYFYLADQTGDHSILVFYHNLEPSAIYPGQKAHIAAAFNYHQEDLRYTLEICEENHGIFFPGTDKSC
jgi:DNA/RNA endonuclease YhcR with UshA esterase domain